MAEQRAEREDLERKKPARKCLWCVALLLAIGLVVLGFLLINDLWKLRTIDEELAAIEAARAIPDAENAGAIYDELVVISRMKFNEPEFFMVSSPSSISGPWFSQDHPETAELLSEHQSTIANLMQVSRKEKCRFPIPVYTPALTQHITLLNGMRSASYLLVSAGNNDIAEGRIDSALEKYLCIIQMAKHLYQQPMTFDFLVGIGIEALALQRLNAFIVDEDPTETHLEIIEGSLASIKNNWNCDWPMIRDVERLHEKFRSKQVGYFRWLLFRLRYGGTRTAFTAFKTVYFQMLARRRGLRILITLRRYKNKHGVWPENLGDIVDLTTPEILIDPTNGGSFVYKLTEDSFILYSKGKNNIDEGGKADRNTGPDDCLIWPPEHSKAEKENND
jgi:hypothetical protein